VSAINKNRQGFTLIEVMASMTILLIVSAGVAPAFTNFMRFNTSSQLKTEAMAAASRKLDELRLQNPQDMPTSGSTNDLFTVGNRDFDVETTFCERDTFCSTNNSRHLKVVISYDSKEVFEVETVYTMLR